MIKLHNKFIVKKVVKTKARAFKDLKVGDIVEFEWVVNQVRSCGSSSRGIQATYVKINGIDDTPYNINCMLARGFEFEEIV